MFKEYIKSDRTKVFINADEFADTVMLNGQSVCIVTDNDRLSRKIVKEYDGVVVGDILFFITPEEWRKVPHAGNKPISDQAIMYNNKPCLITSVVDNEGIYEVILQYSGGGR